MDLRTEATWLAQGLDASLDEDVHIKDTYPDLYINSSDLIQVLCSNHMHRSIACENALCFNKKSFKLLKYRASIPFITKHL